MLDDSLVFLAVCRHGSLLGAGRALGLATSTVGRRIDGLEERLGARLFERGARGLTLTEAGRLFRDRAEVAQVAIDAAADAVRALMSRPAGRLRVAGPSTLVRGALGDVAIEYLQRYPDVTLEVVGTDEDVVPDGETLHAAVRVSSEAPPAHLVARTLGRVEMRVVASPGWERAHPHVVEPAHLADVGCAVLGGAPEANRVRFARGHERRDLVVAVALFTTSVSLARRAAVAGLGPVGLPAGTCDDLLASGALVELMPDWRLAPVPVVLLHAGDRNPPLRLRAFLELAAQRLSAAFGSRRTDRSA